VRAEPRREKCQKLREYLVSRPTRGRGGGGEGGGDEGMAGAAEEETSPTRRENRGAARQRKRKGGTKQTVKTRRNLAGKCNKPA